MSEQRRSSTRSIHVSKIIIVNRYFHPDLSATSQMASGLAFSLAESGLPVCILTSRLAYEDPQARLPKQETISGVDIHRIWTTRFGRMNLAGRAIDYMSFYVSAFIALLALVHRNDIVIAKTDPPLISVIAWITTRIKRARLVNWLQDLFPEVAVALGVLTWKPLITPLLWLRNMSLRGAVMNVAIGQVMHRRLIELGIKPEAATVIQNWADGELIKPVAPDDNSLRRAWDLQDKLVVGYSGNMGRAHDFDTIIKAMTRLENSNDIVFLFIGGGAGKQKLERAFQEHGITNYRFMPYQDQQNLAESLSVADIHLVSLLPRLEGLIVPSKIYGIAAAGRPVIFLGAPDGEISEIVDKYGFGVTIPTGESDEMAKTILHYRDNRDIIETMGRNGRQGFESQLDMPCAVHKWQKILGRQ